MIDLDTLMLAAKMGGGGGGGSDPNAVKFTAQTLTSEQQAQARQNIGAAASGGGNGTAYIDIAMTSETEFEMSYKDAEIDAVGIADLVDSGYSVIAKVSDGSGSTAFIPLTNIDTGGKTVVYFSIVAVSEGVTANLLMAHSSSDDGNVGSVTVVPL